jgi:site-specific DNA-methyltransferase (adenine-specific)
MEYMATLPDKAFDLAVVDPPYGIGHFTQSDRLDKYGKYDWNKNIPDEIYFCELRRVSKERVIWGANYYNCFENGNAAIIWDKENPHPSMSRCEIASVSWGKRVNYFKLAHYGFVGKHDDFHPCGKPVALYNWILRNYAKPGQRILDTHLGSGSSAIAAHYFGCDFVGCEIDESYFLAAKERFERETKQITLFGAEGDQPQCDKADKDTGDYQNDLRF